MRISILAMILALLTACGTYGGSLPTNDSGSFDVLPDSEPHDQVSVDGKPDGSDSNEIDVHPDITDDTIDPPPEHHPLFDFVGTIELVEHTLEDGTFSHSQPRVFLGDEVYPIQHYLVEESGDCQFYEPLKLAPVCTPGCEPFTQWCDPDGVCRNWAQRHSVGPIIFEGLHVPLTATPDDTAFYLFDPEISSQDLFDDSTSITLSAPGDELPPLAMELTGVADMAVSWEGNLELVDGLDNVAMWPSSDSDATVELVIQTGWHGSPSIATIWCSAPDSQGQITIPQHMAEMYPLSHPRCPEVQ